MSAKSPGFCPLIPTRLSDDTLKHELHKSSLLITKFELSYFPGNCKADIVLGLSKLSDENLGYKAT